MTKATKGERRVVECQKRTTHRHACDNPRGQARTARCGQGFLAESERGARGAGRSRIGALALALMSSMDALKAQDLHRLRVQDLELFTVHLMGSAKMGSSPQSSVVNLSGELWDLPGCFIADASVFPSAVGVNPQVTIMAMATRIASRMVDQRSRLLRAA